LLLINLTAKAIAQGIVKPIAHASFKVESWLNELRELIATNIPKNIVIADTFTKVYRGRIANAAISSNPATTRYSFIKTC
jgi:hypothetical protein